MLIKDQFGIIQNLQTSPILQTSLLVGTFFCCFLQQDGSSPPDDNDKTHQWSYLDLDIAEPLAEDLYLYFFNPRWQHCIITKLEYTHTLIRTIQSFFKH